MPFAAPTGDNANLVFDCLVMRSPSIRVASDEGGFRSRQWPGQCSAALAKQKDFLAASLRLSGTQAVVIIRGCWRPVPFYRLWWFVLP